EQVERDELRRRLAPEPLDARGCGMEPGEEERELGGDDLAVEHESLGRDGEQRLHELREVARERPVVAAPQVDGVAAAEREAAEAVPLRLVEVVADRELTGELAVHRS